ncbi:hypothetical protein [Streptomyces sp. ST2-7A]|nr:hypothetical protein [Streptomyces sp. ST2-7A]MCE7078936.1 hypothetical protein [Streptomyces sp. ST2-7A]
MSVVIGTPRWGARLPVAPLAPVPAPLLLVSRRHIDYCRRRSTACSRG